MARLRHIEVKFRDPDGAVFDIVGEADADKAWGGRTLYPCSLA